jgi:hypothetical protein
MLTKLDFEIENCDKSFSVEKNHYYSILKLRQTKFQIKEINLGVCLIRRQNKITLNKAKQSTIAQLYFLMKIET